MYLVTFHFSTHFYQLRRRIGGVGILNLLLVGTLVYVYLAKLSKKLLTGLILGGFELIRDNVEQLADIT